MSPRRGPCRTRGSTRTGQVEIAGVLYAKTLQRTRAVTEAIHLSMRHAFDDLGYRRFEWKCDSLNEPSRRARDGWGSPTRAGRNHMITKGRNRDTDWFSVTDAEWPLVKGGARALARPGQLRRERNSVDVAEPPDSLRNVPPTTPPTRRPDRCHRAVEGVKASMRARLDVAVASIDAWVRRRRR